MKIKTKVAVISIIVVIVVIFVFNSTVANLKIHDIPTLFFIHIPTMIQNNPISHSFVVDDIRNTIEYKTFDSTFSIYDEGIIHASGHNMEYKVIARNTLTDNLLVLDLIHYTQTNKIVSTVYCLVGNPENNSDRLLDDHYDKEEVIRYMKTTDCLDDTFEMEK